MPKRAPTPPALAEHAHAVFLRGINVGGAGRITMDDLRRLALRAGGRDPRTYIQSGNIVVGLTPDGVAGFASRLEGSLQAAGVTSTVIVQREEELRVVADEMDTLLHEAGDATISGDKVHALLFSEPLPNGTPSAEWQSLLTARESFSATASRTAGIMLLRDGVARSKVVQPKALQKGFGAPVTMRNINTVKKVLDLCATWRNAAR